MKPSPTLRVPRLVAKVGILRILAIRDYRLLWLSTISASFAMQMQVIARGWLIYDMTGSPLDLAWVTLSYMVPWVIFSMLGGVLADRFIKKAVIIGSQVLSTIAVLVLATYMYLGTVTFWDIIYFGIFNGTVVALSMPARSSIIPEIVPTRFVVNAVALSTSTFNISRIVGPALAGGLIVLFAAGDTSSMRGISYVYFIVGAIYSVAFIASSFLHYSGRPLHKRKPTIWLDIVESFKYIRRERVVAGLLLMGLIPLTFGTSIVFLLPAFTKDVLGGDAQMLGLLTMWIGIGSVVGSLTLAIFGDVRNKGPLLFRTAWLWTVFLLGFALSNSLLTATIALAFAGVCSTLMSAMNAGVVQLSVRNRLRGRVNAIIMMSHGLMPLGVIPVGILAELVSIQVAILASAAMLFIGMIVLRFMYPELREIDRAYDSPRVGSRPRRSQQNPQLASPSPAISAPTKTL